MDNFPELTESFSVSLLPPADIGRLSINSTLASIQISANQDPNGVVELRPLRTELVNGGGIQVEETAGFVEFEVVRSGGTFGEISVMLQTSSRTATSAFGKILTCIHMDMRTHAYTHTYIHTCMHAYVHARVCVCVNNIFPFLSFRFPCP